MQAEIKVQNTGKRVIHATGRYGDKPNEVVTAMLPPGLATLTFKMDNAQDAAKFRALSAVLTDAKGPLGYAVSGKRSVLDVTVIGGESVPAADAKQGASKAGR